MIFNRRKINVQKKHVKAQSNPKSTDFDSNTTMETEMMNTSPLEDALEKYFSANMEKQEAIPSISQDFIIVVPSMISSFVEFSTSACSLDGGIGDATHITNDQKTRPSDESNDIFFKNQLEVSEEEALTQIAAELTKLREQSKEIKNLIEQRSHKFALYSQDKNCGMKKRHQVIIEMQRLLRLESQRDSLLKHEGELEHLQMMIKENACGYAEVATSLFHNIITRLSSGDRIECNHSCVTTFESKSSEEIYEEAQTRVEMWKLLNVTNPLTC